MLTRADLQQLAQVRLEDAKSLLRDNRPSSAYYLAGYAVELGIKACISKQFTSDAIPERSFVNAIYTHDLRNLLATSGLLPHLTADMRADPTLGSHWGIVVEWTEASRYKLWDQAAASDLILAIDHQDHGILQWVMQHW
jgi:hypothetical protein